MGKKAYPETMQIFAKACVSEKKQTYANILAIVFSVNIPFIIFLF